MAQDTLAVWLPVSRQGLRYENSTREMRTCSKKEGNEREDHLFTEFLVKEEHAQHDLDRDQPKNGHGIFDDFENPAKLPDVPREPIDQMTGEAVGPEAVLALTEGNLELDILLFVPILLEEVDGMFEGRRTTLDAVVHPRGAVLVLVKGYRRGLPAYNSHALNDGDFELVGVLSQSGGAGLVVVLMPSSYSL